MRIEAHGVGLGTLIVDKTCRSVGGQAVPHLRRANLEPLEPQLRNVWALTGQTLVFLLKMSLLDWGSCSGSFSHEADEVPPNTRAFLRAHHELSSL